MRAQPLSRRQFLVASAGAALAACTKGNGKPRPGAKNLSGRIQVLTVGGTPPQLAAQQRLIEAYVHEHSDVGVDFIRTNTGAEARDRLDALLRLERPPDLVLPFSGEDVARLVDRDMWLDLRRYLRDADASLDDLPRVTQPVARMTAYYGDDSERVVGLPVGAHTSALACNVDLFTKAKVGLPPASLADQSWKLESTFLDTARRLTTADQFGVGRISPAASYFGFGGRYYDGAQKRAQFDRPAAVAGAQFAGDLVTRHHVQVPPASAVAAWRAGKVAMIELCSCELGTSLTDVPFRWQLAAMPAGPTTRHTRVDVQLGAIVAASTQDDMAWRLLRFLALDPAQAPKAAADGFGAIPVRPLGDARFPSPWIDAVSSGSTAETDWLPAMGAVHDLVAKSFDQVLAGKPATEVMPKLQRDAQAAIDRWFDRNKLP
jgi:ABC-type glycerol-3-phosphate transport system substrate-binding protein